jgi:hypothetical protein
MRCNIKKPVASGNWSNPAVWDGGSLPSSDQIVVLNNFTLNVDQNATVRAIVNHAVGGFSVSEVPWFYSDTQAYTTPNNLGTLIFNNKWSITNPARHVFDHDYSGSGAIAQANGVSVSDPAIVGYVFPTPKIIDKIYIGVSSSDALRSFEFQASNDGTTWTSLFVGDTGNVSYFTPSFNTTTAYTHYRLLMFSGNRGGNAVINTLQMLAPNCSLFTAPYNNGGSLTLDAGNIGGLTLTLNDTVCGLSGGNINGAIVTYTGNKNFTIVGNIHRNHAFNGGTGHPLISNTGTGVMNFIGNFIENFRVANNSFNSDEERFLVPFNNRFARTYVATGLNATTNIVGTINIDTTSSEWFMIIVNNNHNLNITGDIVHNYRASGTINTPVDATNSTVTIVGDIDAFHGRSSQPNSTSNFIVVNLANCQASITGSYLGKYGNQNNMQENNSYVTWSGSETRTLSWIGKIETQSDGYCLIIGSGEGVMLSGPIVCSPYGWFPISGMRRINWIQNTTNTYIQFRTNQAMFLVQPTGTPNPTYNLVTPDTLVDLPAGDDVRLGTVYGAGSFQGTLAVPPADRVSIGVPVDDTVGTGTINAKDVWDYSISNLNATNSIGKRLKNASTVDSTGDQLSSLL